MRYSAVVTEVYPRFITASLLSVRTMSSVSIFSVKVKGNQSLHTITPNLSELACFRRAALSDKPAVDMALSLSAASAYIVNGHGDVFEGHLTRGGAM